MDYEFWLKIIGAFGITVGLLLNWRTHSERTTFEMIDRLYSLCHTLESHLLREWRLSHLFCIGKADYKLTKERVTEGLSLDERKQFSVKEQLLAVHIFIVYEQVLYQFNNSTRPFHRKRRKFLEEMLAYFTNRLLLNPRLQGFLLSDLSGEGLHLERESVRKLLEAQEEYKKIEGVVITPDRAGPFAYEGQQVLLREPASKKSFEPTAR